MNKLYRYCIFALDTYLTELCGAHFPKEIIRIIMSPIVLTRRILEITTSGTRMLKSIFGMMCKISKYCRIKIISQKGIYSRQISYDQDVACELDLNMNYFDVCDCDGSEMFIAFDICDILCRNINIYLKNNYPLILEMCIDNLGKFQVYITSVF